MVKDVALANADDLGDVVEREMRAAAEAIEEAARRLAELLNAPRPEVTPAELNVNKGTSCAQTREPYLARRY